MLAEIFTVLVLLALFMLPLIAGRLRDKLASFGAGRGAPQVGTPGGHGGSGHRPGRDLQGLRPRRQISPQLDRFYQMRAMKRSHATERLSA